MFNILHGEREHMADSTQVHELFKRVKHPQLQDMVKDLEVRAKLYGITYLEAAKHLTATVSKIPEYQFSRKVAGIQASEANSGSEAPHKGGCNRGSIYNFQGEI